MALRRHLATRLFHLSAFKSGASAPSTLQRRAINRSMPEFMSLPVGEKLREKINEMSIGALGRPQTEGVSVTVEDVRKIMKAAMMEKVKERVRSLQVNAVSYSEFVEICAEASGSEAQGLDFAKLLDDTGNVIVWGNVVFLRPQQVAKSMERLMRESIPMPNDPLKEELEKMEKQKAEIDKRAETLVRRELYGGLGFVVAQTAVLMRLTFWELSWDVMEPICFFVTSLHFALAYTFFLRTSREPSFQAIFRTRFRTKQQHLIKVFNFDVDRYERLYKAFYPSNNLCVLGETDQGLYL